MKGAKRNIEWSQESLNWMSGCEGFEGVHCEGCYAKFIAEKRLRGRFGYPEDEPFSVVFHPDKLEIPFKRKAPRVFFSVSMGDWMYAEVDWRRKALKIMRDCPHHIFVTLTKQYDRLRILHWIPVPKNVIIGISVTNRQQVRGIDKLREVDAFIRLVCFEPLLEDISDFVDLTGIGWIIIGKRTRQGRIPEFRPEKRWVDALIVKARKQDIPVFVKPNLDPHRQWYPEPIEETPYDYIWTTMLAEEEGIKKIEEYQNKVIKKVLLKDE